MLILLVRYIGICPLLPKLIIIIRNRNIWAEFWGVGREEWGVRREEWELRRGD